jgi:hypothetical protein
MSNFKFFSDLSSVDVCQSCVSSKQVKNKNNKHKSDNSAIKRPGNFIVNCKAFTFQRIRDKNKLGLSCAKLRTSGAM